MSDKKSKETSYFLKNPKAFAWLLVIMGLIGLFSSLILTADKIHVLRDPDYSPSCNINPLFSCGSVMKTPQADFYGVPNTLFGVVGFTAVVTVGAVILAGARMGKRFWRLFNLGLLAGVGGVAWLFYQSVFIIGALCVYCMTVWVVVLLLFWYTLLWNNLQGNLKHQPGLEKIVVFLHRNHFGIILLVYLMLVLIILNRFWYFFGNLF